MAHGADVVVTYIDNSSVPVPQEVSYDKPLPVTDVGGSASNAVRGGMSMTGAGPTAITNIAAPTGTASVYIRTAQAGNSSVTTVIGEWNDTASTQMIIPAGSGNNPTYDPPLKFPAATAPTFTISSGGGQSTIYIYCQGYVQ